MIAVSIYIVHTTTQRCQYIYTSYYNSAGTQLRNGVGLTSIRRDGIKGIASKVCRFFFFRNFWKDFVTRILLCFTAKFEMKSIRFVV